MNDAGLARRYARALYQAAGGDRARALDPDLSALTARLTEPPGDRLYLNPTLASGTKRRLVLELTKGEDPLLRDFLAVVIDHRREGLLADISRAFHQQVLAASGLTEATVESARELSDEERLATEKALRQFLGRGVAPRFQVDRTLIGGVRVRYGDRMIDASVLGNLRRMRTLLARTNRSEVTR